MATYTYEIVRLEREPMTKLEARRQQLQEAIYARTGEEHEGCRLKTILRCSEESTMLVFETED